MNNTKSILLMPALVFIVLLAWNCTPDKQTLHLENIADSIKHTYAPDGRTAIFDVNISYKHDTILLEGETSLAEAIDALTTAMQRTNAPVQNHVTRLPDTSELSHVYALANNSVINMRRDPAHSAEMVTQTLMGTPLTVLKQSGNWYLVQTPDRYIAWTDAGSIHLINKEQYDSYLSAPKLIYLMPSGSAIDSVNQQIPVTDLVAGNILMLKDSTKQHYVTMLPDGRKALVAKSEAQNLIAWINHLPTYEDNLVKSALLMQGIPYLWGGTSTKGADCSGFTKTIYFLNGYVIPRDASQQIYEGITIDDKGNFDLLKKGDLLFFGQPKTATAAEKVIHVGMWIGNGRFIHASGNVHISSVDPSDEHYDEYNVNRYLRTQRLINTNASTGPGIIDLRKNNIYK